MIPTNDPPASSPPLPADSPQKHAAVSECELSPPHELVRAHPDPELPLAKRVKADPDGLPHTPEPEPAHDADELEPTPTHHLQQHDAAAVKDEDDSPKTRATDGADSEEEDLDRRVRRRRAHGVSPSPPPPAAPHTTVSVPRNRDPEGSRHLQNLERVVLSTHSKNLGSVRRLDARFGDAIVVEHYRNGGGEVIHVFPENLPALSRAEMQKFAVKCMEVIFGEDDRGFAHYCFGVIHNGAREQPNILRFIAEEYPKTEIVKEEFGHRRMTEVMTIGQYVGLVDRTLSFGTHRAGTMRNITLVGCEKAEETGGYFEDVLELLEKNVWLKESLPWGRLSKYPGLEPSESDDGPIMWTCPGEQVVSVAELQTGGGTQGGAGASASAAQKRKRTVLDRLTLQGRNEKVREKLIEDRTGCHADMAGYFPDRHPVAAVGFVQSVDPHGQYDLKDIIAFHAEDMDQVADECGLYFQEEPKDQLMDPTFWADEAKLNQMRRLGIKFAHIRLQSGDIYCIPRRVVHQFQTVCGCISVTWHLKYAKYYHPDGKPKLDGTKGQAKGEMDELKDILDANARGASPTPPPQSARKRRRPKQEQKQPETSSAASSPPAAPAAEAKPVAAEAKPVVTEAKAVAAEVKAVPAQPPAEAKPKPTPKPPQPKAPVAAPSAPEERPREKEKEKEKEKPSAPAAAEPAAPKPAKKPPKKHWDDEDEMDLASLAQLRQSAAGASSQV